MDRRQYIQESAHFIKSVVSTRDEILSSINKKKRRREVLGYALSSLEESRLIISSEIANIQKTLKEDIDSLVTIALGIVYEDRDIAFSMIFDKNKAGQSQYKPVLVENGEEFSPKDEQCGGALDVISYALRIILHSFEKPKGRDFLLFDEPFKFLGGGVLGEKAAEMAKKINADIGIQAVVISHDDLSINRADKVYGIEHDGKRSHCREVGAKEIKRVRI